jgi:hypothetical protein
MSLARTLLCERTEERRYAGECSGPVSTRRGLGSLNRNNDRKAIKSAATMAGNSAGKFGEFCAALLATGCGRRSRSDCGSQDGGDRVEPGEGRKKQRERSDPALLKRQAAERVTRARYHRGVIPRTQKTDGYGSLSWRPSRLIRTPGVTLRPTGPRREPGLLGTGGSVGLPVLLKAI